MPGQSTVGAGLVSRSEAGSSLKYFVLLCVSPSRWQTCVPSMSLEVALTAELDTNATAGGSAARIWLPDVRGNFKELSQWH